MFKYSCYASEHEVTDGGGQVAAERRLSFQRHHGRRRSPVAVQLAVIAPCTLLHGACPHLGRVILLMRVAMRDSCCRTCLLSRAASWHSARCLSRSLPVQVQKPGGAGRSDGGAYHPRRSIAAAVLLQRVGRMSPDVAGALTRVGRGAVIDGAFLRRRKAPHRMRLCTVEK